MHFYGGELDLAFSFNFNLHLVYLYVWIWISLTIIYSSTLNSSFKFQHGYKLISLDYDAIENLFTDSEKTLNWTL